MPGDLFDVKHQLIFYGKYHSNKVNVAIHMVFVPLIVWTALVGFANFPLPDFVPKQSISVLEPYLRLEPTWGVVFTAIYALYYLALDPIAAVLYWPILGLMLLSSSPIAEQSWGNTFAASLFATSWVAQFAGHGFAEKRAPALLDNLVGGGCLLLMCNSCSVY
ncbi:hypothetical protein M422DRAFT_236683 [Sphaerobolus stellatus SS14]|uniref:DUF962-domain-containing protein n=1 Tax=Sphaerobolus stellatus (strain SS14) TaxID=990650 RepID=A0A0C9TAB8_SPHS4|nr:hypothetical protein M422DRAFT_236683 [Sphaerobolus stellatus SS14]